MFLLYHYYRVGGPPKAYRDTYGVEGVGSLQT